MKTVGETFEIAFRIGGDQTQLIAGDAFQRRKLAFGLADQQAGKLVRHFQQMLRDADRTREAFDLLASALEKAPNDPGLLYDYGMTAETPGPICVLESALRPAQCVEPTTRPTTNPR